MSTTNTFGTPDGLVGTLNGFYKETYAKDLGTILPDGVILLKELPFNTKDQAPGNLN